MFTIRLNKMRFFGHHGLHDEEGIIGTEFEVAIEITISNNDIARLDETVNYVTVYDIVKKHFNQPTRLLETLAIRIVNDVSAIHSFITSINITINKNHPPIDNFTGTAGISYTKSNF